MLDIMKLDFCKGELFSGKSVHQSWNDVVINKKNELRFFLNK